MKKVNLLNTLLKAGIIAAGTGVGMLVSKCFSVEEEEPKREHEDEEPVDVDFVEVKETEEG